MRPETFRSRRSVLQTVGGSFVGVGASAVAAAEPRDAVEVNVGFASDRGRKAALDAAASVVREFAFDALTVRVPEQAVADLRRRPDVRYVEANGRMQALAPATWGYTRVNADEAYYSDYTGTGADVAVIGTGIDSDHPCLQGGIGPGYAATSCSSWDGECNYDWDDDNGHGTRVATVIGANENCDCRMGVAPDATLHAVKVLDSNGGGSYSDIADGIEYTADQGWEVANLSLGGGYSSAVHDACQYAHDRGVTLVAAAGNDGPCSDCVGYPAAHDKVIAVSATASDDSFASFSSQGPEIELAAPGESIYTPGTDDRCDPVSGTSMAAPFVSGAAAVLRANGYGHGSTRSRLRNTARDVGLPSNQQGHGLLDVAAALGL